MEQPADEKISSKGLRPVPAPEFIHCAVIDQPNPAEKHKRAVLRYFVLGIALVAVFLLIAIALYYTQGSAGPLVHASHLRVIETGWDLATGAHRV